MWKSTESYVNWYYAGDFTHISFYNTQTFDFMAENFSFEVLGSKNGKVILLQNKYA